MDALGVAVLGVAVTSGAGDFVGDGVAVGTGKAGPLLLRVSRLPWGSETWARVGALAWPPWRPNGGDLVRSQQMVAVAVWSRTRHTRLTLRCRLLGWKRAMGRSHDRMRTALALVWPLPGEVRARYEVVPGKTGDEGT